MSSSNFGTASFTIGSGSTPPVTAGTFNWGLWSHWNEIKGTSLPSANTKGTFTWWNAQIGKKMSWIGCGEWTYPSISFTQSAYAGDPTLSTQMQSYRNQLANADALNGLPILMIGPAPQHANGVKIAESAFYNNRVIAGDFDADYRAIADVCKAYGKEVHVRMYHEMNGGGFPGCGWGAPWDANYWASDTEFVKGNNGTKINTPATFKAMWKHVVDIFRVTVGCTNVKFWFSVGPWPSSKYWSAGTWGNYPIADYYPGDSYVDYLGIELYNSRTSAPLDDLTATQGYSQCVVQAIYNEVCALSASRPVVFAEMGCQDSPYKAAWVTKTFNPDSIVKLFPRCVGIMYWDDESNAIDGKWSLVSLVDVQSAAITAFRSNGFKNGK